MTTIVGELRRIADEAVPAEELREGAQLHQGPLLLQLESPHGTIQFGLRREVLEGRTAEPTEVLDALDAVTTDDVQRVST